MLEKPLFIPVILGTPRQGRQSEPVAKFLVEELAKREGVETELVDIRAIAIPTDDAGESIKDPQFSQTCDRADGFAFVVPEYNHSFPGLLKHVLDTNLKEYIHKAAGICGVSAGSFGGTRVIQSMLPVMREIGLTTTFYDLNFSSVHQLFDAAGNLRDRETYERRADRFIKELVWMSTVLRYGRENICIQDEPGAGVGNLHAIKPCPEQGSRAGEEASDTVMSVSQADGKTEARIS